MFETLKKRIASFLVKRRYLSQKREIKSFNEFITNSHYVIFIMPSNEKEFSNCFDIIKYFQIHKKIITLFLPESDVNLIPDKDYYRLITYSFNELNKFGLPSLVLKNKLNKNKFDVLIDLNLEEDNFYTAIVGEISAKYRIGVNKKKSSQIFNFQINCSKNNSEISYRNLLNSLQMF